MVELTFQLCLRSLNICVLFTAESVLALVPWPSSNGAVITWQLNFKPVLSHYGIFPKLIVFLSRLTSHWQIRSQAQIA